MNALLETMLIPRYVLLAVVAAAVVIFVVLVRGILNQAEEIKFLRQRSFETRDNPSWLRDLIQYWHNHADMPSTVVDQRIAICRCSAELQEVAEKGFIPFLLKKASKPKPAERAVEPA